MTVKTRKILFGLLLGVLLLSAGRAFVAEAEAEENYILKEGRVYRVEAGKETLLEDEEPGRSNTDKGLYSWILVGPELREDMKDSKSGIYFFLGEDEEPAGFLPFEGAAFCNLAFSPDGEKFLLSYGPDVEQELSLYVFDGFVKKASFKAWWPCAWVDPYRFVFTQEETSKGARGKGVQYEGWLSVVLYDLAMEELFVLSEATETQDYILVGVNHEEGLLEVLERSVKKVKDWDDEQKVEDKDMTVPIPAAG